MGSGLGEVYGLGGVLWAGEVFYLWFGFGNGFIKYKGSVWFILKMTQGPLL